MSWDQNWKAEDQGTKTRIEVVFEICYENQRENALGEQVGDDVSEEFLDALLVKMAYQWLRHLLRIEFL